MKRLLLTLVVCLLLTLPSWARQAAQGWCQQGGSIVSMSGLGQSLSMFMQSYPGCTISVNISGAGPAVLYADNSGTPLANPFTADTQTGYWQFFADNGRYDVTESDGGLPSPYAIGNYLLADPASFTTLTLNGNTITMAPGTATVTIPNVTDTLVNLTSMQTLLNKTLTGPVITAGTINSTTVGATTPSTGSFTTLNSTGGALNGSIGGTTPAAGTFTTILGGVVNNIAYTHAYATMQLAEAACTTTPCLVVIDAAVSVTANDSPASRIWYMWTGGQVTVNNAVTWTMGGNNWVAPDNQQIVVLAGTGAVVGLKWTRPEWFGSSATIRTAVATLDQTNGGTVYLRNAVYRSGFEDNTQCSCGTNVMAVPNVTIQGAQRAQMDSLTSPTKFVTGSGSIIQGTFNFGADHFKMVDVSEDVGPTFVTASYAGQPDNAIAVAYNAGHGQWQNPTFIRVGFLGNSAAAAFHGMLLENVNQLRLDDIVGRFNTHGIAIKGTAVTFSTLDLAGHGSDCLILKADTSIALGNVNGGRVSCAALTPGDTGGVRITAGTASVGGPININQIIAQNTFFGLLVDQVSNSLTVTYLNVDSLQMDAAGAAANAYACFQVSTQLIYANIGKIKCTNSGYVVEGNTGTFSNPDFINIGDIVGVNQHTAAISVALGGRWKFGTTNLGGTQASPAIAASGNAKLQWCLNCLYADGWSTTFATAAGGASIDLGIDQAAQFGATCSTSAVAGNVCTGNSSAAAFTWPAATWTSVVAGFPDAGYVLTCSGANGGTGVGTLAINSYNATSVTTAVAAITAAAAKFTNVECHGRE